MAPKSARLIELVIRDRNGFITTEVLSCGHRIEGTALKKLQRKTKGGEPFTERSCSQCREEKERQLSFLG